MVYFLNEIFVLNYFSDSVKHIFLDGTADFFRAIHPIIDQAKKNQINQIS